MKSMRGTVQLRTGHVIRPPSWWISDEDASASMLVAMDELSGG